MCRYMYLYYYSCRHQRTTLLDYCDEARAAAVFRRGALASHSQGVFPDLHTNDDMSDHDSESFPALSLTRSRESAPTSAEDDHTISSDTSSSSSTGSCSITDKSILEAPSAIAQQHLETNAEIPDTDITDMAGLRPFDTLKSWIGGSQNAMVAAHLDKDQENVPPPTDTFTGRQRQPGIRMYTDESCEMPKSSDILQHLAESPIGSRIRGTTVTQGHTPDGSVDGSAVYEHSGPADCFETLEAEVDALKADIVMLKCNASASGVLEDVHQQHAGLTPAQRMQKEHQLAFDTAAAWSVRETVASSTARSPPDTSDFPALGIRIPLSHAAHTAQAQQRKPSYASAAASSVKQQPAQVPRSMPSKIPKPSCDATPGRSPEYDLEDSGSVVVSLTPTSPLKAKGENPVPRFAQPTKSFARRASETLRRESANVSPPAGGSPKGLRTGAANVTEKRDSPASNKRQSLPSEWLSHGPMAPQKHSPSTSSPVNALSASDGEKHRADGAVSQQTGDANNAVMRTLQKKRSSYMSPTAATKQRSIAKVADGTKHTLMHARSGNLKLDINRAKQVVGQNNAESASSPESAVEMAVPTPTSPPKKTKHAVHSNGHDQEAAGHNNVKCTGASLHQDTPTAAVDSGSAAAVPASMHLSPPLIVPNTIVTRRTSHSEMLAPIIDRLDNQGLLRGKPDQAYVIREDHSPQRDRASSGDGGRMSRRASKRSNYCQPSEDLVDIAHFARQAIAGPRAQATQQQCTSEKPVEEAVRVQNQPLKAAAQPLQRPGTETRTLERSSSVPCSEKSASSSLRATAKAFEPFWKPKNDIEELGVLSWSGKLDQYPPDEWAALPNDIKQAIKELRRFQKVSTQMLSPGSPRRGGSPSKRSQQRFWGALKQSEEFEHGNAVGGTIGCANSAHDANPFGSPEKKKISPSTFGGPMMDNLPGSILGPAFPQLSNVSSPSNPSISPTSDDSSLLKTPSPGQYHAWTIGAGGYHARPYGWKGGDGHEISFSGYGPQAEMNPHTPVNLLFYPNHQPARSTRKRGDVFSPSPKVWPRSQKQWAELAKLNAASGMQEVTPCGNMDFVSAAEQFPSVYDRNSKRGYCDDCVPENA